MFHYRPDFLWWMYSRPAWRSVRGYFHIKNPYLLWIKTPMFLRDATATPILFKDDMKPEFNWLEYVH